jgi:hypothetical protein
MGFFLGRLGYGTKRAAAKEPSETRGGQMRGSTQRSARKKTSKVLRG